MGRTLWSYTIKMTPFVRPVEPGDETEWHRLLDALWPGEPCADHEAEIEKHRRETDRLAVFVLDRGAAKGGSTVLGGLLEASLRQYADGCTTSPVGYIEGWYIDPDLRQQGFGAKLVRAAEDWARSRGCTEMASDCAIENDASEAAHRAVGFEVVSRAILFRKSLKL